MTDLLELFSWFHMHPELAMREYQTTARIREELARIDGLEILDLGLPTGALARVVGDPAGPVVCLRADIDALPIAEDSGVAYASINPGCMHACGHDFHLVNLLGVARILGELRQRDASAIPGTVVLLFQPAEETGEGARAVMGTGALQALGVSRVFGLHVQADGEVGAVYAKEGPLQASADFFRIVIQGKGCHAAYPHLGLDPIVAASRLVCSLQEIPSRIANPLDPVVVTVGRFRAGTASNVIPDSAELEGTIRTFDPAVRSEVIRQLELRAHALEAEGYQVTVETGEGVAPVINDAAAIDLVRGCARELGLPLRDGAQVMGGEDFSAYAPLGVSAFYKVGVGSPANAHTPRFKVDPAPLPDSARLMAHVALAALRQG